MVPVQSIGTPLRGEAGLSGVKLDNEHTETHDPTERCCHNDDTTGPVLPSTRRPSSKATG